jgi:tRNA-binding EMAP/Myf-like protein
MTPRRDMPFATETEIAIDQHFDNIANTTNIAEPKKSNHQANIVRIAEVLPHPDPDTTSLELIHIDGYQVVVRKENFKIGDLAVYLYPDSVVPQTEPFNFIWADHVGLDGKVPEKRRRITVRKFRGQWSEGLLLPVSDFPDLSEKVRCYDGADVSDLLGITHYDPDAGKESVEGTKGASANAPRRKYPKSLKGWFFFLLHKLTGRGHKSFAQEVNFNLPVYDVEALKNHNTAFTPDDTVIVTEKIHGSNARFVFLDGVMYAGSRNQWKHTDSPCVWRKALKQNPWIETWCRAHEGYALYGEVTPTQKGFDYGCAKDQVRFFVFDIRTSDGKWIDESTGLETAHDLLLPEVADIVPCLYVGPYDPSKIMPLVGGRSLVVGAAHIREGIVIKSAKEIRVPGLGRLQLKIVSNEFLQKDSK